jgi:hypothetical protein
MATTISAFVEAACRKLWPPALDLAWLTPDFALGAVAFTGQLRAVRGCGIARILDARSGDRWAQGSRWDRAAASAGIDALVLTQPLEASSEVDRLERGTTWVLATLAADRRVLICVDRLDG